MNLERLFFVKYAVSQKRYPNIENISLYVKRPREIYEPSYKDVVMRALLSRIVDSLRQFMERANMKKIKKVSEMTDVSRRTLQFYDEIGLLTAERTENNYRVYDKETLGRLWRILIYREISCKLTKIKELLNAVP